MTKAFYIAKDVASTRSFKHHLTKDIDLTRTLSSIFLSGRQDIDCYLIADQNEQIELAPLIKLANSTGATLLELPKAMKNLSQLAENLTGPTRFIWAYHPRARSSPILSSSWQLSNFLSSAQLDILRNVAARALERSSSHYSMPLVVDKATGRITTDNSASNKATPYIQSLTEDLSNNRPNWQKKFRKLFDSPTFVSGSVLLSDVGSIGHQAKISFHYETLKRFGLEEGSILKGVLKYANELFDQPERRSVSFDQLVISCRSPFLFCGLAEVLQQMRAFQHASLLADDLFIGWGPFASILDAISDPGSTAVVLIEESVSVITKVETK